MGKMKVHLVGIAVGRHGAELEPAPCGFNGNLQRLELNLFLAHLHSKKHYGHVSPKRPTTYIRMGVSVEGDNTEVV